MAAKKTPLDEVKALKEWDKGFVFLTEDEPLSVLRTAKAKSIRDWTMILTTYTHGRRAAETCRLNITDLDMRGGVSSVQRLKGSLFTGLPFAYRLRRRLICVIERRPREIPARVRRRIRELGGHVRQGETGLPVVYWKFTREVQDGDETIEKRSVLCR